MNKADNSDTFAYLSKFIEGIKQMREEKKAVRLIKLPDKPAIYLEKYGKEDVRIKRGKSLKFCSSCKEYVYLSYFNKLHAGLYLSVLCKGCLKNKECDAYEYEISPTKVSRTILYKIRHKDRIESLDYKDVSKELLEMYRKTIILKTKTKWQNQEK